MKALAYILFFTVMLTRLTVSAADSKLPFFVPAMVNKNNSKIVTTLSSYELATTLRLHPEISPDLTLEAQMELQLTKLARIMPLRAEKMGADWRTLAFRMKSMMTHLTIPPGVSWQIWAKPQDVDLKPVAASSVTPDGRWFTYLDQDLFPLLNTSEKAQVLWQLMWEHSLDTNDNLQIRMISNYLYSKEWKELSAVGSADLFQRLGFTYFESAGFCFLFPKDNKTEFYNSGVVKQGMASEDCVVKYKNQNLIFKGPISLTEDAQLYGYFNVSEKTPFHFNLAGTDFRILKGSLYTNGQVEFATWDGYKNVNCINSENQVFIQLPYATVTAKCIRHISFYENGVIKNIGNSEITTDIRGQKITVGELEDSTTGYDAEFFETGRLRRAYFQVGSILQDEKEKKIYTLNFRNFLELTPDGYVKNQ